MKKQIKDGTKVKGFFRLNIVEDVNGKPKVVGDSGWRQNQITNLGFNQYLAMSLGSVSGSKYVSHVALGTGGAPAATDTALAGEAEVDKRAAVTAATSSSSKAMQFTATFSSGDSFVTATKNIANIGLFNTSAQTTGTVFAGNTYSSSAVATNQNVNVTYTINFV